MATYKGIPFNGGLDSPTGTGSQHIVETLKAIIDFLVDCTTAGTLRATDGTPCVAWDSRLLTDSGGAQTIDWQNSEMIVASDLSVAILWRVRSLLDGGNNSALNWGARQLLAEDGSTTMLNWANGNFVPTLPTSDPAVPGALWNNAGVVNVSP